MLSKEWMQKTLSDLGFTENDSKVYVYLVTAGSSKAKEIAKKLNLNFSQVYRILKKLQVNGIVIFSSGVFSAVIFDKVLEILAEDKQKQHNALLSSRKELLLTWRSITKKTVEKS